MSHWNQYPSLSSRRQTGHERSIEAQPSHDEREVAAAAAAAHAFCNRNIIVRCADALRVLVNVSCDRKKGRSQNSRPQPEKRVGHKTRDPNPKKGSVTKLATPSRKKGRSQNSRPHHRADPTLATATTNPRSTNNSIHTVRMRADIPHLCGAVMLCIQSAVSPLND